MQEMKNPVGDIEIDSLKIYTKEELLWLQSALSARIRNISAIVLQITMQNSFRGHSFGGNSNSNLVEYWEEKRKMYQRLSSKLVSPLINVRK